MSFYGLSQTTVSSAVLQIMIAVSDNNEFRRVELYLETRKKKKKIFPNVNHVLVKNSKFDFC